METFYDTMTIEKYRKSDSGDRIFLFLDHRDLRSEFSAIDMAEAKLNRDLATEKQRLGISINRWFNSINKVLREIFSNHRPSSNCS